MAFKIACQQELESGQRCPKWTEISQAGILTCWEHSSGGFIAANPPKTILFLFYVGKKGFAQAKEAGVRIVERREEAIIESHRQHAELLDLDPNSNDPRVGSGTSVFDPAGVSDVNLDCREEIQNLGYIFQDVHGYAREKGGTIVLALSKNKERVFITDMKVQKFIYSLWSSSWHLYLYAFPPDQDGLTCHTVEGHMRKAEKGGKAFWKLSFDRGLWKLAPRASIRGETSTL